MKIRNTPRVFDIINDLGYKNLLVGGCSFTFNISDTDSSSWPYYIRDKCGFDQVYDCSVQGASNYQILTSITYSIETTLLDPKDTLVIVMWSGYTRDSEIVGKNITDHKDYVYDYTKTVKCVNTSNKNKTLDSYSLENYVYIILLWEYLNSKGYNTVFLNFVEPGVPSRDSTFAITKFLPPELGTKFKLKFSSIENAARDKTIDHIMQLGMGNTEFVQTLKIHGANYSLYTDGVDVRRGKRSGLMDFNESFNGDFKNHNLEIKYNAPMRLNDNWINSKSKIKKGFSNFNMVVKTTSNKS
jgi:hypothetical protein